MGKHHANVLIALGIVICTGFLISTPAFAGSGRGLAALESGELLNLSPGTLLAGGSESRPVSVTDPPGGEETDDLSCGTDGEPPVPATTWINSEPQASPVFPGDTSGWTDDERLADLINTAGISLMRLSMEHAHALYLHDAGAGYDTADDLYALSTRLLREVQSLHVSPGQEPTKERFIRSLEAYSATSRELLDTPESMPEPLKKLAGASEDLEAVSRQTARRSTTAPTLAVAPAVRAVATPPVETLSLMERYTYDDPSGENMVSLLAESTRTVTAYRTTDADAPGTSVEAGEGRMFLLVVIKSTNLGHRGDTDIYAIETPGRNAFTLEYRGTTFAPLDLPAFTSLGESFDQKRLERYESLKGYLYFDVPASLDVSEATLRADLGYAGTPAWDLGKAIGEPDTAETSFSTNPAPG